MLSGIMKDLLHAAISSTRRRAKGRFTFRARPPTPVPGMSAEEAECRRRLDSMPHLAEAHNRLGVMLKNSGRLVEAEDAFRRAVSLQRADAASHYNLGIVLAETRRPLEAEAAYRRALELEPGFVEAHNNLGVVLMGAGRLAEAQAAFRHALDLKPGFADARRNLDRLAADAMRSPGSDAGRGQARASAASSFDPHVAAAVVLAGADGAWGIEAALRDALKSRPNRAELHNDLGVVLAQGRRHPEAEAAFRRALESMPDFADAQSNLGGVLKDTGRIGEAEAAFRRAMVVRPEHEAARMNLDFIVRELERLSREEAACRRAIDSQPASTASHVRLGKVLLALGRGGEAVAGFRKAVSIEPDHADAWHHLGLALSRIGNLDEAIACHARAISIEPRFAQAMAGLAAAHYMKGEAQQAVAWNRAALAIEPRQVEANQSLARILLESGEREEAKRHLDQAHRGQSFDIEYASNPVRTVLLLWTRNKGNVPTIEFLFPTTINNRINWVIESEQDDQTADLPAYDVVFNAMGDPDLIGSSVEPVRRFACACAKPLLNAPDRVARTARNQLPSLLDGIDGVHVPRVWRFASSAQWDESLVEQFPLLIRPVDSHGGEGLELARNVNDLARCRGSQRGPVYVCRFIDYRSDDSWFRKYRIIFIDREPHPCHLAISRDWMVHYYTADMESHPWKLEEENVFLRDPEASLGRDNMEALRSIGARIDLEYAGIDFSIMEDRQILVFEANPTMLVHPERIGGPVEHKNAYVFRIQRSFEEMLKRRCQ